MKKMKLWNGAVVLLIALLMVLSSVVVMANTDDVQEATSTVDSACIEPGADFALNKVVDGGIIASGVTCYASNLHHDPIDNLVSFDSDTPGTFNDIADISSTDFLAGGCFVGGTWWACEYSAALNSNVWTIDETNGDMTLVGASGAGLNGIAYDPSSDTLYGCDSTNLYTIDQGDGSATLVGPFNAGGVMIGIACDSDGVMYGEDLADDNLYEIDTSNGGASLIGALGIDINYAQDIAYDKVNDVLYSTGYKGSGAGGGAFGTLDLSDGHYTYIDDFPIGALGVPSEIACLGIPYGGSPPPEPELEIGEITGGFGISATIENVGDGEATDTDWSITLDGGLIILGKETTGTIASIPDGDSAEIKSGLILGIGKPTITVTAECSEGSSDEVNATGFVLLFFVLNVA